MGQPQMQQQQQMGRPPMQQTHSMGTPNEKPQGTLFSQQQQQPGAAAAPKPQQQQNTSMYQNATPLASLGPGAAPVDCPVCKHRAMTRIAPQAGGTTQYVSSVVV